MGSLAFLGGFLAVCLGGIITVSILGKKIQAFSRRIFGKADMIDALSELDCAAEATPRSLNGCDSLLLPQILKDFPDFDIHLAKNYAKDHIKQALGSHDTFTVHNVVIARYLPSSVQKTIVFQAAVSFSENRKTQQKRYDLHYTYMLAGNAPHVAANCPNCGGTISFGATDCPYCGSRVVNVLGNCWKFTQLSES